MFVSIDGGLSPGDDLDHANHVCEGGGAPLDHQYHTSSLSADDHMTQLTCLPGDHVSLAGDHHANHHQQPQQQQHYHTCSTINRNFQHQQQQQQQQQSNDHVNYTCIGMDRTCLRNNHVDHRCGNDDRHFEPYLVNHNQLSIYDAPPLLVNHSNTLTRNGTRVKETPI